MYSQQLEQNVLCLKQKYILDNDSGQVQLGPTFVVQRDLLRLTSG